MSIHFIKAGLETSIQDLGRFGQMHNGISQSGAMDPIAMQMANWLVSNPLDSPVIEITLMGPTVQFKSAMSIAICGAQFVCYLNDSLVPNDETIQVNKDDVLSFKKLQNGIRAYLAFSGIIATGQGGLKPVLDSYSTHLTANFGGYHGRSFKDNDMLIINHCQQPEVRIIATQFKLHYSGNYLLRCVPSVESESFNEEQCNSFYSQSFTITPASNRMGIRLFAKPIIFEKPIQIISSGLTQGSIQIPPSGQPIISSVDGQTIGGYPRIANVISADLPILGQLKAKDKVRFVLIDSMQAAEIFTAKQCYLDLYSQ